MIQYFLLLLDNDLPDRSGVCFGFVFNSAIGWWQTIVSLVAVNARSVAASYAVWSISCAILRNVNDSGSRSGIKVFEERPSMSD
jgi:apolipoprotein N-acyltransferase